MAVIWRTFLVILIVVLAIMLLSLQRGPILETDPPPRVSLTPLPLDGGKQNKLPPPPTRGWEFLSSSLQAPELPAVPPAVAVPMPPARPAVPDVGAVCRARNLKIWVRIDGVRYDCP